MTTKWLLLSIVFLLSVHYSSGEEAEIGEISDDNFDPPPLDVGEEGKKVTSTEKGNVAAPKKTGSKELTSSTEKVKAKEEDGERGTKIVMASSTPKALNTTKVVGNVKNSTSAEKVETVKKGNETLAKVVPVLSSKDKTVKEEKAKANSTSAEKVESKKVEEVIKKSSEVKKKEENKLEEKKEEEETTSAVPETTAEQTTEKIEESSAEKQAEGEEEGEKSEESDTEDVKEDGKSAEKKEEEKRPYPREKISAEYYSDSHFFSYLIFFLLLSAVGYLAYHNKRKIMAMMIEGRSAKGGRVRYHRLNNDDNFERNVIY